MRLASANGRSLVQPRCITWSYRNLGSVQRIQMKKNISPIVLARNQPVPRRVPIQFSGHGLSIHGRKFHPPRKRKSKYRRTDYNMCVLSYKNIPNLNCHIRYESLRPSRSLIQACQKEDDWFRQKERLRKSMRIRVE